RHGTIPGLGPPAPAPAGISSDVVASAPAVAPQPSEEADEIHELTDDTEMEEVDAGELLTSARSAGASGLPVGGEDDRAAAHRPAAREEPRVAVVDDAAADAIANDPAARAAELAAELEGESDRQRLALTAYELGEVTERRLRDEAGAVKSFGRALQADPSLRPNLWAIRRVFYRRGLWPNLLKLIDAEVRF